MKIKTFIKKSPAILLFIIFIIDISTCNPFRLHTITDNSADIKKYLDEKNKITILFFNDIHGHLLSFNIMQKNKSIEVGGVSRMSGLVKKIREENRKNNIKTFLFIAGDILQGTPMSNQFQGRPDIECFNEMGVNAMVIGNHEFDFGLENFYTLKNIARFPIISSNIIYKNNNKLLAASHIIFKISKDISLTVIGTTTDELLITSSPAHIKKIVILDSVSCIKGIYDKVKNRGPVLILSHNRFRIDSDIAKELPGLAAIIGGHDHFLFKPFKTVSGVPIFQAFEKGEYLGRIDIAINNETKKASVYHWDYIRITSDLYKDPAVEKIIQKYTSRMSLWFKEIIGETKVFLNGERQIVRYEETNLGNLITDIMKHYTKAEIAFINAGNIRSSFNTGKIKIEDAYRVIPYDNNLILINLTGNDIINILKRSVQGSSIDQDGGFLQVSGIKYKVNGKNPEDIWINSDNSFVKPAKIYKVVITDFLASGGDGYNILKNRSAKNSGLNLRDIIIDYIRKKGIIKADIEGRIIRIK